MGRLRYGVGAVRHSPASPQPGEPITDERWAQVRAFNHVHALLLEALEHAQRHGVSFRDALEDASEALADKQAAEADQRASERRGAPPDDRRHYA